MTKIIASSSQNENLSIYFSEITSNKRLMKKTQTITKIKSNVN